MPTGTLSLTATGNISQVANATITAGSTAGFNATNDAITLDQANTFSGAVDLSNTGANNVTLSYNGPLVLGAGNIASGNLNVTNTANITQAANTTLAVGGTASFNTSNGVITLNQANAFTGAVALTNAGAFDVTLNNGKALVLGTSNVATGNLVVSATGNITQAANTTLAVAGNTSFSATNGAITLTQTGNSFNGSVALANTGANNVTLSYNGPLVLVPATSPAATSTSPTAATSPRRPIPPSPSAAPPLSMPATASSPWAMPTPSPAPSP